MRLDTGLIVGLLCWIVAYAVVILIASLAQDARRGPRQEDRPDSTDLVGNGSG